ncbi:DUF1583 domain-containing protein [Pirellulaceae bacterium SH449]
MSAYRYISWLKLTIGIAVPFCLAGYLVLFAIPPNPVFAEPLPASVQDTDDDAPDDDEITEEERRQVEAVARFVTVLEKNPRRGTAFDRVYGHHVEFGTLDKFVADLKKQANAANAKDEHWMILGMLEYQRGNDADAVEALTKAESIRTNDPLPAYYLGQAQIRIGDGNAAVESFERALQRKPQRADQLEIFQQLGRLHQRAQRTDEAMKVWKRLEELYPDDARVLEQIAITLSEENQFAEALPRFEKLAAITKDDYRRTSFAISAAETVVKQGNKTGGIARLEKLLEDLNPEGWLYRDVRRRIDDCFLRSGDQDGLVAYYQSWLETHPQDIEAMNRLARFLKQSARNPEAAEWLNKALTLAPKRPDIRKTYIDLLAEDKRFEEAAKQFEQLINASPGNTDYLRDWGKMILRNKETPEPERRKKALAIWNRILEPNPKDAVLVSQVADLCRQNQMPEEAEGLYRRAIELAPSEPQYREYLGEFLHIQKRAEEARAVWQAIAAGERRNAINLARLAEIYNSFGFSDEACDKIAESIELDPKEFTLVLKGAEYHNKAARFDGALKLVEQAEKLVANDDERESVLNTRINVLQSSQQLDAEAEAMEARFLADAETTSRDWYRLARYRESQRQWEEAASAIDKAMEKDPQSILAFTAAARIAENAGDFGRAADLFRKLTQVDRRSVSDHWTSVTRLETQMGRKEQALEAAKQLIVSAPSKTESYEFYAQTCFRLGETDEGLQALRKAIRINPNEPSLMMALGTALSEQMRTDEAIELYWRAYEKSEELSDKSSMVTKLVPLYSQLNQIDKLFERLERERQEEDNRRGVTISIAQAWQTLGDIAEARKELEGLLSENTRDTNLLNQLAKLCQDDADMDAAINYQRQLVALAPGDETESPLASMLLRAGEMEEAREIYAKLIMSEEDPVRQLRSLDALLNSGNYDTALRVMEPMLERQRDDWELLYRYGVCWQGLKNNEEAKSRFEQILALPLPHDTLGRAAAAKMKQAQEKARSDNLRGIATTMPVRESALQMANRAAVVRTAVGLIVEDYYSNSPPTVWTPESYGLARMAALGWMLRLEQEASLNSKREAADGPAGSSGDGTSNAIVSFADSIKESAFAEVPSPRAVLDWLYICVLKNDYPSTFALSKKMAANGDLEEKRFFLQSLRTRETVANNSRSNSNTLPKRTPLSDADLEFMQVCFDNVNAKTKDQDLEALYGPNIAYDNNGQAYVLVGSGYQPLPGVFRNSGGFQTLLMEEYRFAGKTERIEQIIQEQLKSAKTASDWIAVLTTLRSEERTDEIPNAIEKWRVAALKEIAERPVVANRGRNTQSKPLPLSTAVNFLQQWIGQLGSEEENERVLQLLANILEIAEAESQFRVRVAAVSSVANNTQLNSNPSSSNFNIPIYYGKTTEGVLVTFPPATTELDTTTITLLRQVFGVLQKNSVSEDMLLKLRTLGESKWETSVFWKWCLAAIHWWGDDQDGAMNLVARIMVDRPQDAAMQFRWIWLLESRNEFEDALAIVNQIAPRDQSRLILRESAALRLAERVGDTDRARQAAERLFGLRLTSDMQMQLVPQMRRLGMDAQADAIMSRMERTSARQPSSLLSLMNLYQSQGKIENANQTAMAILRKTTSPYSAARNTANSYSPRIQTSENSQRQAAVQQLVRSGALKKLLEQLKEKLDRSPDSVHTLEQLIEFSMATNQKRDADEYLAKALNLRPESHVLRWNLASNLSAMGKYSEACDQYLRIMDAQPSWITDEYYEVQRAFSQAKRQGELFAKLASQDLRRFRNSWGLINMVSNALQQNPTNAEGMIGLIERIHESQPNSRSNLIRNLVDNPSLLRNDRVFELVKRSVTAGATSGAASNPWSGLDQILSYSEDSVEVVFSSLINMARNNPARTAEIRSSIELQTQKNPNWLAGHIMLGLLEMSLKNKENGLNRIQTLLEDESTWTDMPYEACWFLGLQLASDNSAKELAIRLLKEADLRQGSRGMSDLTYSPISALAKLVSDREVEKKYVKERLDDIQKKAAIRIASYNDSDYEVYQRVQGGIGMSRLYLNLGYPVDSYLAAKAIENELDSGALERFYGDTMYIKSEWSSVLSRATKAFSDQTLPLALDRLLPESGRLDLMVKLDNPAASKNPDEKSASVPKMQSELISVLKRAAKKPETQSVIADRLAILAESRPGDIEVRLTKALWMIEQDCEGDVLAEELSKILELAKLEPIAEGRRPNNRQREQAKTVTRIWLVAREILKDNASSSISESESKEVVQNIRPYRSHASCRELALKAADLAVEASERMLNRGEQCEVLLELASVQAQQNLLEQATKNWKELLHRATSNNTKSSISQGERTGPADVVKPDSSVEFVPALTISQFRIVMSVHNMAAKYGDMELAARALGMSLRGGMPVSDPNMSPVDSQRSPVIVRSGNDSTKEDPIEKEVQNTLQGALAFWDQIEDTPVDLFDALRLVVLPANRPEEVRLFVNGKAVEEGREESLASSLVRVAAKSNKLDFLRKQVMGRIASGTNLLSKDVLLALIAIEKGDQATAKSIIEQLIAESEKLYNSTSIQIRGLLALRACEKSDLRNDALPLLKRLVTSQLTSATLNNDDLFSSSQRTKSPQADLVARLNRYLIESGDLQGVQQNFESILQSRTRSHSRYSNAGYGASLLRDDLRRIAQRTSELDLLDYTMDLIGRSVDLPIDYQYRTSQVGVGRVMEYLIRSHRSLESAERYQVWRDWTMPNSDRGFVRMVFDVVSPLHVPAAITDLSQRGAALARHEIEPGVHSNLTELVVAAVEANQLVNLKKEVEKLSQASDSDSASQLLLDLITIEEKRDSEVAELVNKRILDHYERKKNPDQSQLAILLSDGHAILASYCRKHGYLQEATKLRKLIGVDQTFVENFNADDEHWIRQIRPNRNASVADRWYSPLPASTGGAWLRYPITGDFTISWDTPKTVSTFEFASARLSPQNGVLTDSSGLLAFIPRYSTISRSGRIEIQVESGEFTIRIDGLEITKETTWGTSPWLALEISNEIMPWRNLRIEGNPTIPSEVRLIAGDTMEGWSSTAFNESQRIPRRTTERIEFEKRNPRYFRNPGEISSTQQPPFDWLVEDGNLKARKTSKSGSTPQQSWLQYGRPLASGETFRYEFFSKKEEMVAHPTIGNVALVLKPDGLYLHYIDSDNDANILFGLNAESMFQLKPSKMTTDRLPIREEEWNQVSLTYSEGKIDLIINDELVYSLPVDTDMSTQFGFFRYKHQECLIRNVVLSGAWPSNVSEELVESWNASNKQRVVADVQDRSAPTVSNTIAPIDWRKAVEMDNDASVFELLALVLPTNGKYPRLSFEVLELSPTSSLAAPERLRNFVQLDCVAVELAKLAYKQNRTDDVLQAIAEFQIRNPGAKRVLGALRCLLAIESSDEKIARQGLESYIQEMLQDDVDLFRHLEQAADFVVAWRAASPPSLRGLSKKIVERIEELDREERSRTSNPTLIKWVKRLAGDLQFMADSESIVAKHTPTKQWTKLDIGNLRHGNNGGRSNESSTWVVTPGKTVHYGSDQSSPLIFQSPLTGQFEILAERTTWDRQEIAIMYAMHAAEPKYDLSKVSVSSRSNVVDWGDTLDVPGFRERGRARFRIVVNKNEIVTYTNDVKIYEHAMAESSSPWLMLEAAYPDFRGEVDNLRIVGTPTIPDELILTSPIGYEAWDGSLGGQSITNDEDRGGNWMFRNGEVIGNAYSNSPNSESYIRYLRPMLEDGVVEYECWSDENTEVHPAIGGQAFLLNKDGLKIHRIGFLPDKNSSLPTGVAPPVESASKPIEWKSGQWNRVRLELQGDELSIAVNDEVVATVSITDPPEKRHIGMLGFGGTQVRFRNMTYRGEWPKSLPPLSEQVLALPDAKP